MKLVQVIALLFACKAVSMSGQVTVVAKSPGP